VAGKRKKCVNRIFFLSTETWRPKPGTRFCLLPFAFCLIEYRSLMSRSKNFSVYENLDTSFVNLGALLRYLQQRDFIGRVHLDMGDYEADVHLRAGQKPLCRELDRTTGREAEGDAALQRLLVRALDAGGRISVYSEGEGTGEEYAAEDSPASPQASRAGSRQPDAGGESSGEEPDWQELLRTSAELIAAVERATRSVGANFELLFGRARLELADDYSFLDPNAGRFEYVDNEIELHTRPGERAFVSGLCETLRRVVERAASGGRATGVRERVALELAVLARRRQRQLRQFGIVPQLDRIAGTRVI
jgi:hypothetical protein